MERSIDIVREIQADAKALQDQLVTFGKMAADLQKKLLNLPGSGGANSKQSLAIDQAQDGLRFWRRTHLEKLKEVFNE